MVIIKRWSAAEVQAWDDINSISVSSEAPRSGWYYQIDLEDCDAPIGPHKTEAACKAAAIAAGDLKEEQCK